MANLKNLVYFEALKLSDLLRFFRINDPYRLVGLLVMLLLLSMPLLIDGAGITYQELKVLLVGEKVHGGFDLYTELVDSTAPLTAWFNGLMDILFGRSILARHIFSFIIIFTQSVFLGFVFIDKKAFAENTFIPSLIFSILFLFSFDTLSLTGDLLAFGFMLWGLNSLFKELEFRAQGDETVLKIGIYISLASLCSFSFIVYLPAALTILIIFSGSGARKNLLLVFGFLLPHLLLMSIFFFKGSLADLWEHYYLPGLSFSYKTFISTRSLLWLGAIPLLYLIISLVMLNREARFTKYQSQLLQTMFFWMLFSVLQILYSKNIRPQSFIVLIPSLSFFYTHFLLLIKRKRFAEMNLWIIVIAVVTMAYGARYGKIIDVNYAQLLVPDNGLSTTISNRKVLVLDEDISLYKTNKPATGFIDWTLASPVFKNPDYYENVGGVYHAFRKDAPEIIVDRHGLMPGYFNRIPSLKHTYIQTQEGIYQRQSSASTINLNN